VPDGLFQAEVVTPEASLLSQQVRRMTLASSEGDYTVLDGHTRLVTDVVPGEVQVEVEDGSLVRLAVHGGYLQVDTGEGAVPGNADHATMVTLLAGAAERSEDIDVARAERARDEAQSAVSSLESAGRGAEEDGDGGDVELAEARASLRRAEVRLAVASAAGAA
jgi:F-type H+-transporting ATPase subunit epsilon